MQAFQSLLLLSAVAFVASVESYSHKSRRLDEDIMEYPPFINEFGNEDSINNIVEIISYLNVSYDFGSGGGRRVLEKADFNFGDTIQFFDGNGTYLGSERTKPDGQDPDTRQDDKGFKRRLLDDGSMIGFQTISADPAFLPRDGGYLCLVGQFKDETLFARNLGYGNAAYDFIFPPAFCLGSSLDEHVADDTTDPVAGQFSYQRTGEGYRPEDFVWTVQQVSPALVNENQNITFPPPPTITPICPDEGRCDGGYRDGSTDLMFLGMRNKRYTIHKKGLFFRNCRSKCVGDFFARIFRLFGWRCGACSE